MVKVFVLLLLANLGSVDAELTHDRRKQGIGPQRCPDSQLFTHYGSWCTCRNLRANKNVCPGGTQGKIDTAGCLCPPGMVFEDNESSRCVRPSQCAPSMSEKYEAIQARCPDTQIYGRRITHCTCEDHAGGTNCVSSVEQPRCGCPHGTAYDNGKCVSLTNCRVSGLADTPETSQMRYQSDYRHAFVSQSQYDHMLAMMRKIQQDQKKFKHAQRGLIDRFNLTVHQLRLETAETVESLSYQLSRMTVSDTGGVCAVCLPSAVCGTCDRNIQILQTEIGSCQQGVADMKIEIEMLKQNFGNVVALQKELRELRSQMEERLNGQMDERRGLSVPTTQRSGVMPLSVSSFQPCGIFILVFLVNISL